MVAIFVGSGWNLGRGSIRLLGSQGEIGDANLGRSGLGAYVNAATGVLNLERSDEILVGKGPDDVITSRYASNGVAWFPSTYRMIGGITGPINTAGSSVVRQADCDAVRFTYDAARGAYVSREDGGAYEEIRFDGSTWSYKSGDSQTVEYYENHDNPSIYYITRRVDTNGNTQTYSYIHNGGTYNEAMSQITNADGSHVDLDWIYGTTKLADYSTTFLNPAGAWTTQTRIRQTYDSSSRLATVTVDLSPGDNSIADGNVYVTTYSYDGASTRIASITQSDGSRLDIAYDGSNRVASYSQTVAAGVIRTTSFDYSVAGRTTVTDPAGQKTILFYDANKLLTQISYPAIDANTAPRVVQFAYNSNGDVISVTHGPGDVTTYDYDTNGNRILERDSAGNTIKRTYGSKNELLTETRYLVPDPDGAGSGQPSSPLTTRYAYDSHDNLRYVVSAEGMVSRYDYDTAGQQIVAIDFTGSAYSLAGLADNVSIAEGTLDGWSNGLADKTQAQRTETTYDYRGDVATVTSYSKLLSTGLFDTSSELSRTTYVHDSAGNLLSRLTNASSASEVFVYDGLGRQTMATDFNGNVTRSYFLDARGQTVVTHANGLSEISTYDRAGELTSFSQSNAGANLVDLSGWPGNPGSVPSGQATVAGWMNPSGFTDETRWANTVGPDGIPVVAMQAGQLDASAEGGGNYTHEVPIDPTKAYEFTFYFKLSDLDKHYVFFGTSGSAPATVENLSDGADNNNPYFFYAYPGMEAANFAADKWYKLVGYVLPQGSALSATPLGGVYDAATGAKILDNYATFRWNGDAPPSTAHARFFDYYGEANQEYSTYFYQPEIRQVSTPAVTGPDQSTSLYRYDNLGRLRMTVDPTGRRAYMMYDNVGRKVADIDADGSVTEYRYDGNDNLTSTTRYANKLSSGQLASLVDGNGNPTSANFASLRPTANSSEDQWTFQVYDAAQRLVQTIDGTGATTVYAYDGASRATSTTTYANRIDAGTLANLKALAVNPNRWELQPGGQPTYAYNLAVAGAGTIDGANAFQMTIGAATDWQAVWSAGMNATAGQTVTATISLKAVGSTTLDSFGLYGGTTGWDPGGADASAVVVSGPGQITYSYGGFFQVSGLSATDATRVTITRTYHQAEWGGPYFYVGDSSVVAGRATVISGLVYSSTPVVPILPTADAANDRVTRSFYDADGRIIATMDAAGGLSQITYDKAGRKVTEIGSAKAVTQSLRAAGTLAQMITDVGTSTSDRRADYVYDARGYLRYTLDASAKPIKYISDAAGRVIRTVSYAGSITPASSYSVAYVESQVTALGLDSTVTNTKRVSRTVYDADGQAAFTIDATGSVNAFTYDNVGNVTKQVAYATAYATFTDDPSLATMQSWAGTHASDTGNGVSRSIYDVHGRVAYTVNAEGYVVEHRYDQAGRATRGIQYADVYTVADGATKASMAALIGAVPSSAVVTTYAYDADGLLSDVTDGVGAVTHITYNSFGDVRDKTIAYGTSDASTLHYSYDVLGRVDSVVAGYGTGAAATTSYTYDAVGNVLVTTDALSHVWIRTYDAVGRVLTVTAPVDSNSANDLVTVNQYDAFGDLVKVTDPRGNASFNYYDALGRVTLQSDAEGYITQTSYTAFGEIYQVTRRAARGTGTPTVTAPPTVVTGSGDATTTFTYDKMGRVLTVTDAGGGTETYGYDAFGDRTQVWNKLGGLTTYIYDRLGQLYYGYQAVPAYLPDGTIQQSVIYDPINVRDFAGRVVDKVEGYGSNRRDTYYYYDKAGRAVSVVHTPVDTTGLDLATITNTWPNESYTYNLRGDLIQSIDAGGGKTLSWYDALGRKTDEVNAVGTLSHWTYDGNGNVATARVYGDAVTIPGSPGGSPPSPVSSTNYRETSYSYDRSNRLIATTVAALRTGYFDGTNYVTATGDVTTTVTYDKNSNIVKQTDGNGNVVWTWYDKLNRKVAQVDRENALATWTLDANGNATAETRYATKIAAGFSEATAASSLPGLAGTNAADRSTSFTYDRNGRRLTETRSGVAAWTVSGLTLSADTTNATITYTYNALGQVTSKTESTGDLTTYVYDLTGRLITTKGATMVDNAGSTIRLQTDYYYDGLGDVVRTVQHGDVYANAADRITTSSYGAGGRLASTTDANGFVRNYAYDAAGRVVKESWTRLKSDGSTNVTEAIGYRYDLAGRLVTQSAATWNGSSFVFGDATRIRYDSYGEVTGRGITGGPNVTAVYQEVMDYDAGGRVWRTTAGDGTIKLIFYDKGGNATLTVSSTGADLSGYTTQASAFGAVNGGGGSNVTNAVTTIAMFDKNGQQTQSREPGRQLTASSSTTIISSRVYNAFGEVTSETDARGYTTSYSYNKMGRMTQKVSPIVNWTGENGTVHTTDHPTENYYYDISGRMIAVDDANGNRTTRQLLAGTGYGGTDALVRSESHADGGVAVTWYNVFGDARAIVDELGATEYRAYDNMDRVTSVLHRGALLTDYYTYDGLGERTRHYNSLLGSGAVERTDYDVQGRVTLQTDMAGGATTIAYSWDAGIGTSGMGTFGGWTKTTTLMGGQSSSENTDYFSRTTYKSDFGGHAEGFGYDLGGRLLTRADGLGQIVTNSWFNTGALYQAVDSAGSGKNTITATYGYDAAGNRTYEGYSGTVYSVYYGGSTTSATLTLQNATIAYDALGRITSFIDKDASNATRITVTNEYDLNGNVRRTNSVYPELVHPEWGNITQDRWYRYDNMNRMVVADGALVSSVIVRGNVGEDVTYDAAGRRRTQTKNAGLTGYAMTWVWYPDHDPNRPGWHDLEPMEPGTTGDYQEVAVGYGGARQEQYTYRDDGELATVKFAETGYTDNGDGTVSSTGTLGSAVLRAQYDRDAAGRITEYREFGTDGTTVTRDRYSIVYDGRNNITSETVSQKKVESGVTNTYVTNTVNSYSSGLLSSTTSDEWKNGSDSAVPDTLMSYSYAWYDGARVSSTSFDSDTGTSSNTIFTSTYYYDSLGRVASVDIADGRRRTVSFAYTAEGQILNRKERSSVTANPEDQHYFVAGSQYGELTNNGNYDPEFQDYAQSLVMRNWTPNPAGAAFRWTASGGVTNGIFGPAGYQAVNPMSDGTNSSDSAYIVRAGETLQSIAAGVWGDASLWYLIAGANGMSGGETLVAGTSLTLPDRVTNAHNNADTFRVYDPNRALGDLNPTNAKPPKKASGCAVVGQILMTIVAVAVSAVVAPWATALIAGQGASILGGIAAAVAGGAIGGAAGAVASQAVGIATGIQDGFNWKGVGMAAIGGAIGGGLGKLGALSQMGKIGGNLGKIGNFLSGEGFVSGAVRGLVSNSLIQGIGVATGLQGKFDWASVASAAIGGGIGNVAGSAFGAQPLDGNHSIGNIAANLGASGVTALANAGARSLISGTDFGDNLIAALPDVIGTTIGNLFAGAVTARPQQGLSTDNAYLANFDETTPTLAGLTNLYGAAKANAMMAIFNDATATQLDSHGGLKLTPALVSYLAANAPTGAALAAEKTRLLGLAQTGGLKAYYDFGYANNDPLNRFDRSMVSIGDEHRAALLALKHQNVNATDADIALISARVFGGDDNVEFPAALRHQFDRAAGDLRTFARHRDQFLDGLARSSLAISILSGYPGQSPAFGQAVGEMRAAIDQGYFTLRPRMSISNAALSAPMQQYNSGARSEVIIYREGFSLGGSLFSRGLFHELMHTRSTDDVLYNMEFADQGATAAQTMTHHSAGTTYDPDPKTYYDLANQHLFTGIPLGGNSSHPNGQGAQSAPHGDILPNYETGHLYEGGIYNWYASSILRPLHL